MYVPYGNQIKHEKWSQNFHYSSPPGSLRLSFPLGRLRFPLWVQETLEGSNRVHPFKQMRCCLFLKELERRKFHKLPRLHIPVSIKPHCLKIFPFLLSKSLMQPLKPLASCLVPKGAQHCSSQVALPAPGSRETLHAAALGGPISLCSLAFHLGCYLSRGFLPNSLLLLCVHFKYTLKTMFLIEQKKRKLFITFMALKLPICYFLSPVLFYMHTCVIGGTSCPPFY